MSKTNSKRKPLKVVKHEPGKSRFPSPSSVESDIRSKAANIDAEAVRQIYDEARTVLAAVETEKLTNITRKLASAPELVATEAIRAIGHDLREQALPLLEALAISEGHELALAAIQGLGATRTEKAATILADIAEKSSNREIRKEARRSLFRLKSAGVKVEHPVRVREEMEIVEQKAEKLLKAYMTNPDGDGNQAFDAAAEGPFGRLDTFSLLLSDVKGVIDFKVRDSGKRAWEKLVRRIDEISGISIIEIPIDYFRFRVKLAYELSVAQGTTIKPAFYRWRSLLIEPEKTYEHHPIYDEVSIVEIKWNPELLEKSPEIIGNEEFISWLLTAEDVKAYIEELAAIKEGKVALPPWVEQERAESVTARAIDHFFGPEARLRYKSRLEDMAYLLFHTNRQLDAKRALAAAVAFDDQTGIPSAKHPFALALFQTTVTLLLEQGYEAGIAEQKGLVTDISQLAQYIDIELESEQ